MYHSLFQIADHLLRGSSLPRRADGNTHVFTEMDHTADWGNSETLILTLVYKKEIELGLVGRWRGHPLGEV